MNRYLLAGGLAGLAWWLYTRSQGLDLTGQPVNPMLPPAVRPSQLSLVNPNTSTSSLATNVFSAVSGFFQQVVHSLQAAPGNGPRSSSPTPTGISPADVSSWGLAVPPAEAAPAVASQVVAPDPAYNDLNPFWQWGGSYLSPVPSMPWTLNPAVLGFDPNYIPPPPGA